MRRLQPGNESLFYRIAPDVFDESIHAERLSAYLTAPGHLMVLAVEDDLGDGVAVLANHLPVDSFGVKTGTAAQVH